MNNIRRTVLVVVFFIFLRGSGVNFSPQSNANFAPLTQVTVIATPEAKPELTDEQLQTREITVESSYYPKEIRGDIILIQIENFEPVEVTIYDFTIEMDMSWLVDLFNDEVIALYCGSECIDFYSAQGDDKRLYNWSRNMKFYVEFSDGSFAELAMYPPPAPECLILGVYFSDPTTLNIKFQDFDGEEKMSVWEVTDAVSEVDTLPYVEASWPFASYAFADEEALGFAAMIGSDGVAVFAPDNRMIDRVTPCMRG